MVVHGHRLGERALREQQITPSRPARQLAAGPSVAGVDETALRCDERDGHALRGMRHRKSLETHIGVQRKWLTVAHVENADRESRIEQPTAVAFGQGAEQLHDPRRAEDDERFAARRVGRVLERVHEHRQLTPMVGVEVGQDDVRDLMPGQPELREPVQGAGPAVEQDPEVAALDPVTGCGAAG